MTRTHTSSIKKDINFTYVATPTGKLFHQSSAFVRGMLGPVGCLPASSEFLTPDGWRRMDAYSEGDRIAVWAEDGTLTFEHPEAYIVAPAEGFHTFTNQHALNMELSPGHRMPLYDWNGNFVVKTAAAVSRKPSRHTVPNTWTALTPGLPLNDEQIRVMVMVHADGNFRKNTESLRCVVSVRKPRKLERAQYLLTAAGIDYTIATYSRDGVNEHQIAFYAPQRTKTYTGWYAASAAQMQVILDEFNHWDGLADHDEQCFYTTHREDADFMQYVAHSCGRRATIGEYKDPRNDTWDTVYIVYISTEGSVKGKVQLRGDTCTIGWREPHDGEKQYCFTTRTGFFVMRHNGCVAVTGNSGKSVAMCMEMFAKAQQERPGPDGVRKTRFLVVRSSFPELKATTIQTFLEWFGAMGTITYDSPIRYSAVLPLPDGTVMDWEVWFKPIDGTPASLDSLRSLEITGAFLNEAHEFSAEVFSLLKGRVGRYRPHKGQECRWSGIILDSNYGSNTSPLKAMIEANLPEHAFFEQPAAALWDTKVQGWVPNPEAENMEHLPGGVRYYERQIKGTPDYILRQLLACMWASPRSAKPVFPEFSPRLHVNNGHMPGDRNLPLVIGMDFGLHVACVLGQLTMTGGLRVLAELWDDDAALDDFVPNKLVPMLHNKFRGFKVIICGDPAGAGRSALDKRTPFQVLRQAGFVAFPSPTNDPVRRRDALRAFLLRTNGYLQNPGCTRLNDGLAGAFGYKRLPDGSFSNATEKNVESHTCFAAGTRVSTPNGQVGIETLRIGDWVSTPIGPRRVVSTMRREAPRVVDILWESGHNTRVTPEHEYFTMGGLVRASRVCEPSISLLGEIADTRQNVKPSRVSTTSPATVPFAAKHSLLTNTVLQNHVAIKPVAVRSCVSHGPHVVYDIEVEQAHAFYADGMLVSNCEAAEYLAIAMRHPQVQAPAKTAPGAMKQPESSDNQQRYYYG